LTPAAGGAHSSAREKAKEEQTKIHLTPRPGKKKIVLAGTYTTTDSSTASAAKPSPPSPPHPAPAPTTTSCAPSAPASPPPCGNSPNRLVGILHGCLVSRILYDQATAWPPPQPSCGLTSKPWDVFDISQLDLSGALRLAQDQVAIDHQLVGSQGCAT
jgi:hypothetical protein